MALHRATLPAPPAPLLGRESELGVVGDALADPACRLVTLTGPPGVGKTRLALAAAAVIADRLADGAVFVDVSRVSRESVLGELARAIGSGDVPGRSALDRLIENLVGRELLVVLDNCEHILPIPELGDVLSACEQLRILATSRERLHLTAEREIAVAPLPVPDASERDDPARIAANPAAALLVSRAQAVHAGFDVTAGNAQDIADVCERLDGLPLALELAAAQLKIFSPAELADRLRHRSILLGGGHDDKPERHKGLRTAIGWSHDLMPEPERALFRRLAVFVGGWTLPATESVCPGPSDAVHIDVPAATMSLLDKSLISRTEAPDGESVFRMLESIREFAAEQLRTYGEVDAVYSRHADYYSALAVRAEKGFGTSGEDRWRAWLWGQHGNLRAALEYSMARSDTASALWLAAALGWYWYTRGFVGEGIGVVEETLAATADDLPDSDGPNADVPVVAEPTEDAFAAAQLTAGVLAWSHRNLDSAADHLSWSLRLSRRSADERRIAIATAFRGHVARDAGELDVAADHHERAWRMFEQAADERGAAWARFDLGLDAWCRGELAEAANMCEASLGTFRDLGYRWAVAWSAWALAGVAVERGDVRSGHRPAAEALDTFDELNDRRGIAQSVEVIARIAVDQGQSETAGRLLGAAGAIRHSLAVPGMVNEVDARRRAEQGVRSALGAHRAERALQAGRSLPINSVVALARRVVGAGSGTGRAVQVWPSRREREVAALIATGCTNREIGRALGIAEKTIEAHIRNIMSKLDVHTRAEIAAWAASHGVYDPEAGDAVI